jgi:hypothetical protein
METEKEPITSVFVVLGQHRFPRRIQTDVAASQDSNTNHKLKLAAMIILQRLNNGLGLIPLPMCTHALSQKDSKEVPTSVALQILRIGSPKIMVIEKIVAS